MNAKHIRSTLKTLFTRLIIPAAAAMSISAHAAQPLKVGYSDWPGWVAWQVAIDKGWFKQAGVDGRLRMVRLLGLDGRLLGRQDRWRAA